MFFKICASISEVQLKKMQSRNFLKLYVMMCVIPIIAVSLWLIISTVA